MGVRRLLGPKLPGYSVEWATVGMGLGITVLVGVLAGLGPAIGAARLSPVDALRSEG
jgi:ABC-type antimicrobial peptide transport system permease subunit